MEFESNHGWMEKSAKIKLERYKLDKLSKHMMFWDDIFYGYNKWIDIVSDGILRDTRQNFGQGQQSELEMRESVAKHFIGEPEKALRGASRHHSLQGKLKSGVDVENGKKCLNSTIIKIKHCQHLWKR